MFFCCCCWFRFKLLWFVMLCTFLCPLNCIVWVGGILLSLSFWIICFRAHMVSESLVVDVCFLSHCFHPGGVCTGIAKHHGRYSKSDHLFQDDEEWTSRRKRLRRRIFVKYVVEISNSSRDVCKNKGYRIIGGKQCHSVNKCNLFEITRMQSVNRRIAALFYASVMKVLKVRPGVRRKKWFHRQISATRTTRYYDDFFIISKTNLSLSWLENLVRLCDTMLPSDKIALKHLPGTIREL